MTVRSRGRPPAGAGEVGSAAFVLVAALTLAPGPSPAVFPLMTVSMADGLPAACCTGAVEAAGAVGACASGPRVPAVGVLAVGEAPAVGTVGAGPSDSVARAVWEGAAAAGGVPAPASAVTGVNGAAASGGWASG
ncbi:hypothetical protein ADK34_21895, partial [Streptomyces viridochromogenes]